MEIHDITIIGGGPAGLFAAFYAGMRKANTLLIDSSPQLGGQLAALYPEKYIYDIPGLPKVKAATLIQNLLDQLDGFPHQYRLTEMLQEIVQKEDVLEIKTNKNTYLTKAVILACGNGLFEARKLAVEKADILEGQGIDYVVRDLGKYQDKRVVIAGGGDSAIDWALSLEKIAESVAIVHRRKQFRGHEHSVDKLEASGVAIYTPYVVSGLIDHDDHLTGVQLEEVRGDDKLQLEADYLIVNYGFKSTHNKMADWGIETEDGLIKTNSDMSTSLPGVYACGDIATYDGKIKLIATGFGEAPTAVNNALHFIDPENRLQPAHSSGR